MSESKTNFFQTNRQPLVYAALFALVMTIYYQTIGFDFINLDDNLYIFNNPVVLSGINKESVTWAFTQFHAANWHPVTWLSHLIDVEIFGRNPGGHHATNVLIHLINSILAFTVFKKMTGSFWKSAIVAALFAVHPAHVESVAWVAERKDVLSTMFWLLVMLVYLKYAEKRMEEKGRRGEKEGTVFESADEQTFNSSRDDAENFETNTEEKAEKDQIKEEEKISSSPLLLVSSSPFLFLALTVFFALGLMAKPMLVTLPCVLLLMDYWALERLKSLRDLPFLILEKIPLFILTAISSYITFLAQRSAGSVESLDYLPLETRLLNAMLSYAKYTGMLFYPVNLGVWYPYDRNFPAWQLALAAVFMIAVTALCLRQIKRRKYLLMGWLWFLGTLVPVIGLVQVGSQPLADRYTYVPYFGLFIMLVWGAGDLFERFKFDKRAFYSVFGIFIIVLSALAYKQTTYWRNNEILYKHTLAVTKKNYLIAHNLCHHLTLEDRMDEAEVFCRQAIDDKPDYFEVYNTLGILQLKRKEFAESEASFKKTLELAPQYSAAYSNLALAQIMLGKPEEAEKNLETAANLPSSIAPEIFASALNDLAAAYAKKDNYEKTAEHLRRLLYLKPNDTDARIKLTLALMTLKRYDDALAQTNELLKQSPNAPETFNLQGIILLQANRKTEAAAAFEKALQLKPNYEEAKQNLEKARAK